MSGFLEQGMGRGGWVGYLFKGDEGVNLDYGIYGELRL